MFQPAHWHVGNNTAVPPSVFRRYTELNLKRGLGEIDLEQVRNDPLYIVCSGPSLSETWEELRDRPGHIWGLNAAFDYLCKRGIRPDYGVCLASEDPILNYFQEIKEGDHFLFASQTHPELIDRALDRRAHVTLWHTKHPDGWQMPTPAGRQIYGGGTVGSRSFELAWVLGFRDVHVLGMDACLSPDGRMAVDRPTPAGHKGNLQTWIVNGRAFVAFPSYARQVEDLGAILRPLTGMNVTFYGDGMLQWSQRSSHAE